MTEDSQSPELDLSGDKWRDAYDIICDYYRLALFNSLYCGRRLRRLERANLALELSIAALASSVAILTGFKAELNPSPVVVASLALLAAILSAAKPVLRLSDGVARYAGQHSGFRDVHLAYKDLIAVVRVERRVTLRTWREHEALSKRYRALDTAGDANPSAAIREGLKIEVERQVPVEHLRIA